MSKNFIITSIGSYKTRLKNRKADAIAAIKDDSYWTAQIALSDCIGFEAVIEELEFQLERAEVNHV